MFDRFRKKTYASVGTPEFLVVGLGNPGGKYTLTRHNSGFLCVDMLSEKLNFRVDKLKFKSLIADTTINGRRCIVMKPQTYMNNSGEAVRECASFYKIPPERIIVISDDTSLDIGKMRIKRKGSDGGQKGLRSIIYHMNSDNFPRVKIGVGKKPHPDYDMADWVLSEFKKDEQKVLEPVLENACKALELMLDNQIDKAMNLYNS
ncbi:MAG: aminoacyl-tRNA hydrolase [Ruminococcaceae bacterium]|nr:aminoacyl-tRNA hydrolase [Oscillospiraceae bacterium]